MLSRFRGVVAKIENQLVEILLEDGEKLRLPLKKLPEGIGIGTILSISISVDRIAAFLKKANITTLQKEMES